MRYIALLALLNLILIASTACQNKSGPDSFNSLEAPQIEALSGPITSQEILDNFTLDPEQEKLVKDVLASKQDSGHILFTSEEGTQIIRFFLPQELNGSIWDYNVKTFYLTPDQRVAGTEYLFLILEDSTLVDLANPSQLLPYLIRLDSLSLATFLAELSGFRDINGRVYYSSNEKEWLLVKRGCQGTEFQSFLMQIDKANFSFVLSRKNYEDDSLRSCN